MPVGLAVKMIPQKFVTCEWSRLAGVETVVSELCGVCYYERLRVDDEGTHGR
jgi:hypothetical protein